jgi:hypothetical protein
VKIIITFNDSLVPLVPEYINLLLRRHGHKWIETETDEETFKNLCHEAVSYEIAKQRRNEKNKWKIENIKTKVRKMLQRCIDNLDSVLDHEFTEEP